MKKILEEYKKGNVSLEEVLKKIKTLPYEDLEFAKIDHHRSIRKGFPETIYCPGKNIQQIIKILKMMNKGEHNILATKADQQIFAEIKKEFSNAEYNKVAKTIVIKKQNINLKILS